MPRQENPPFGKIREGLAEMREPTFDVARLQRFVEAETGLSVSSFTMIRKCSRPHNFILTTAAGERFVVKCVPDDASGIVKFKDYFVCRIGEMKSAPGAVRMAGGPWKDQDCTIVLLEWCKGSIVSPPDVTAEHFSSLVESYSSFAAGMERCSKVLPPRNYVWMREKVLSCIGHGRCRRLRRFLIERMPERLLSYDASGLKVIHGDFHHGNIHFSGTSVTGIMDYEDFRYGYPAEDFVRYIFCCVEHLHWYDFCGHVKFRNFFRFLSSRVDGDELAVAVRGLLMLKIYRRIVIKKKSGLWTEFNLLFRARYYEKLLFWLEGRNAK